MKKVLLFILLLASSVYVYAQEYIATNAGPSRKGNYLVEILVSTKKSPKENAENLALQYAVRAVMFSGLIGIDGYSDQKPIITDVSVEESHKEWFKTFFDEGVYKNFATVEKSSILCMKNRQTKMIETSARVEVDKDALRHYLEDAGIISSLSDGW